MGTEVTPMQSVQNLVRDRIRAEFASLIPDEMWSQMVASVVQEFTTDARNQYHNTVTPSPLKQMIVDEIKAVAQEHLRATLKSLDGATWDSFGQKTVSEALQKMIAENFTAILASVQAGFVEQAVMIAMRNMSEGINRMR